MGHLYFAFQGSRDSIGYTFFGNRAGDELQFYAIFHSISVTIDWFIAAVKSQCAAAGYFYIIIILNAPMISNYGVVSIYNEFRRDNTSAAGRADLCVFA